jgi:penicillin-binding protein 1A
VTPLEMACAYAAFANGGIGVQPHVITKVRTANGKLVYARRNASFGRVIDPKYVSMMNGMMQETLLTGTARKAELPGWQAAGKTGTSQDFRDAWFVGYTSYLVAAVWLGNDDDSPTKKVSGGNLPVEIWSRFMKAAHQGVPVAALPFANWRTAAALNPLGALLPPLDLTGAAQGPIPPSGGRGGGRTPVAVSAPALSAPRRSTARPGPAPFADEAPVPPAPIPNVGAQPGKRANDFLDRLFGRL